jgi:hypothetical protein
MWSSDLISRRVSTFSASNRPSYFLGLAVEVESSDRLPVVVIQEDREIGLRVAMHHPLPVNLAARDRPDDPADLSLHGKSKATHACPRIWVVQDFL